MSDNIKCPIDFPYFLIAKPKLRGYQVRFTETIAISEDLLETINTEEIEKEYYYI